ncbi:MAG: glycine--tRNA ligase subunit beta [Actinomycetota bacterium]
MAEADLLFEIGVEEMPAGACAAAVEQLSRKAAALLAEAGLPHGQVKVMATPRRLVLIIKKVAERGRAETIQVKGPSKAVAYDENGEPTPAAVGFARSQGLGIKNLTVVSDGKGEYVFAARRIPAPLAREVFPGLLKELVGGLEFDKSMRWAGYDFRFGRPVRWLVALLGNMTLPVKLEMLEAGAVTYGPRSKGSQGISVKNAGDYFAKMKKAGIVVDHVKRRALIVDEIAEAAAAKKGRAAINPKVLDEVVFLVEAPNAVVGEFDKEFLKLPRTVTVTAMESHQRYFPVESKNGKLLPYFIVIHNGPSSEAGLISAGHERVLRARLADALFFFEEDLKTPLEKRVKDLTGVVFHEKLGSIFEKENRVKALAAEAADQLGYSPDETAETGRAALLIKADLTTNVVREFPELQGIVGAEYARLDGHPEDVAAAIAEHYRPRSFGDWLPETKTGVALSIADKLDTIVGCLGIGLRPTGSEDPYALRRQGQGIVSIVLEKHLSLEMEPMIAKAVYLYEKQRVKLRKKGDILADLEDFFRARLKFHFTNEGFRYDIADAVLASELNDLVELEKTACVINSLIGTQTTDDILVGFERCYNLSKGAADGLVDATRFAHPSESKLLSAIETGEAAFEAYEMSGDVLRYLKALAGMRRTIDRFFDDVLVMDKNEKTRLNRLALLKRCVRLYLVVADFSRIVREGD